VSLRRVSLIALALVAATAPARAEAPASPARAQALADRIALAQLPPGAFAPMFEGLGANLNRQLLTSMLQTPARDFARLGGLPEERVAALGEATLRQLVEMVDPAFEARIEAVSRITFEVAGELFSSMEPELRRAYADVYVRAYSEADLEAIAAFYATPTGGRFAAKQLELMNDPAMQKVTAELTPRLLKALAGAGERVEKATSHLPPPRSVEQMSPAEKDKALALLKGADPAARPAS
jgi:hypothetical protein